MLITGEKWSSQPIIKIGDKTYICTISLSGSTYINTLVESTDFISSSGGTIGPITVISGGYTVDIISESGFLLIKDQTDKVIFCVDESGNIITSAGQLADINTALAFAIAL